MENTIRNFLRIFALNLAKCVDKIDKRCIIQLYRCPGGVRYADELQETLAYAC